MSVYILLKKAKFTSISLLLLVGFMPTSVFGAQGWSFVDTQVEEAWEISRGSGSVVVAVIDNGFDSLHPALSANVWKNTDEIPGNNIDDDNNGYVDDVAGWDFVDEDKNGDGEIDTAEQLGDNDPRPSIFDDTPRNDPRGIIHHGTVVAGIIGATGGHGLNWHVKLMNLRVVNENGTGSLSDAARAIRYAVDNGAHIINMSMVGDEYEEVASALAYAKKHDVLVVAAAGNDARSLDREPRYPVCSDYDNPTIDVIGVSAVNEAHRIASFSNIGSNCIDVTAPGVNIDGTLRYAPRYGYDQQFGGKWSGTSFAAPFVSGAAALIKSVQPDWGREELTQAILTTVHKTPPQNETVYASLFGRGLLQIGDALAYAKKQKNTPSVPVTVPESVVTPRFVSVDKEAFISSGDTGQYIALGESVSHVRPALRSVSSVDADSGVIVTSRTIGNMARIQVFDTDWKVLYEWYHETQGDVSVQVGDVTGDSDLEIILSPKRKNTTVFWVYSLRGVLLEQKKEAQSHDGVSLALVGGDTGKTIAVAYRIGQGSPIVNQYNRTFARTESFILEGVEKPQIAAGNFWTSRTPLIVSIDTVAEGPELRLYRLDGTQALRVRAYGLDTQPLPLLGVFDYDGDGRDDIVTLPTRGNESGRVWSGGARKLLDFSVPDWVQNPLLFFL